MRWVLAGVLVIGLVVGGAAWNAGLVLPPRVSCSIPDGDACPDGGYPTEWVGLSGRPTAIDYREAPEAWKTSADPGFQHAQWAAHVELFLAEPITAACYYSSEPEITCHAQETPFIPSEE